jgi:hypothetical protein
MPDSINSLSPDFRDFLLNRNLITDSVTDNGLDGLLVGIGTPLSNIGTPPEAVQASPDIIPDGSLYKDLNLVTNKFQGNDVDYRLANITYKSSITPPASAFIYSASYTEDDGVLSDTLNTPANGAFQGGNIRQFNTSKNLYDDPSMRLVVNMNDVLLPNVKYTNYIDLNSSIVNPAIDVLGSIFNGQGVGISPTGGGLVPTFDLRSSLVGRVLGGTGVISDTPIGQAGAKYLAISLANNAAFGLQQETLGNLNLNPLNIAKNGLGGIVVPNYDITVPSGKLGKVLDFGAKVLGFESPFSLYERGASIFTSENPISNIDRANAQLANTGKGQVLSLFANVKSNRFRPAYQDDRVKGDAQSEEEKATKGSALNPNMYAFGTSEGKVIDFLNNNIDVDGDGKIVDGEGSDVNTPISQSNYRLEELVKDSGFDGVEPGFESPLGIIAQGRDGSTKFSWGDDKDNKDAQETFNPNAFTSPNSILTKTQRLFNSGKMRTLASGQVSTANNKSATQSAVREGGLMSKGSGVLTSDALDGNFKDADKVFCRTWSTFDRYDQVQDLQKNDTINKDTAYRKGIQKGDSVLDDNGFVRIAPYVGDGVDNKGGNESDIKNYMFSIENLAWADDHAKLLDCEKGPGDPITGKYGRIMWFPPYDLSVTENTSVNWESTNFIGRGEPIYTYSNTERTGTLQFQIVVDHPSYLNALKGETDDYIASFFAGCTDIDSELAKKLTTTERDAIEARGDKPLTKKAPQEVTPEIPKINFYFPNDSFAINLNYETKKGSKGLGTTTSDGIVGPVREYEDSTDFGLNGDENPGLADTGGWISIDSQERLSKVLNEDCQACRIEISGHASVSGDDSSKNQELSELRAKAVESWFTSTILDSTQEIYGATKLGNVSKRFKFVEGKGESNTPQCPQLTDPNDSDKKIDTSSYLGCKVNRKVDVKLVWDAELQGIIDGNVKDPIVTPPEEDRISQRIINRFYNECNYFEKIREIDKFAYESISEKIKFFQPAFHAITPEGLNSRLTFLQQCTRQGPTNISGKPDNLAFGRPPVCILRLGDFYHTKIVIDNVGISYEPLVWDLNPEGIGVQPMLATVDLSFKMIGGQGLKGPINKLQNAVSFNFYGNTQVYDERADKIIIEGDPGNKEASIVPGISVIPPNEVIKTEEEVGGINGDGGTKAEKDQVAEADSFTFQEEETTGTTINNIKVSKKLGIKDFYYDNSDNGDGSITLTCTFGGESFELNPIVEGNKETGPIKCKVVVDDGNSATSASETIGEFTISNNDTTTLIEGDNVTGNPSPADNGVKEFKVDIAVDDYEEFLNGALGNGSVIKLDRTVSGKLAGKSNLSFTNTNNKATI